MRTWKKNGARTRSRDRLYGVIELNILTDWIMQIQASLREKGKIVYALLANVSGRIEILIRGPIARLIRDAFSM